VPTPSQTTARMLPSRVVGRPQPGGASRSSARRRSTVLQGGAATVEADQRGGRASSGREDPCFVAVALHAALIDGRTYRVASSDGAATNPVSGATTGWVLLSGAEQATFTDTFDAAFTDAVITISDHDAGTTSRRVRGC
jgi:hypothetical protein